MAKAKLVKCWSCKQLRSLEWGNRTLCGNCGHQLVLWNARCNCSKCRGERINRKQLEMFDPTTGKALIPVKPQRGRKPATEEDMTHE